MSVINIIEGIVGIGVLCAVLEWIICDGVARGIAKARKKGDL
jgi:hypothetical protein